MIFSFISLFGFCCISTLQVTNQKAMGLLCELEELYLIKMLTENIVPDKYKGRALTNTLNKCVANGAISKDYKS